MKLAGEMTRFVRGTKWPVAIPATGHYFRAVPRTLMLRNHAMAPG